MSLKLLIAEDDSLVYKALSRIIRRRLPEAELTRAEDGNKMFDEIEKIVLEGENRYDLIISDNDIGGPTGLDCLKYARDNGVEVPYLMMSGKQIGTEAMEAGANAFYSKPDQILKLAKEFQKYIPNQE